MAPTPAFWNRIASKYARQPVADQAAYERKLELTRARLRPDMQMLEFACGTGSTALRHAPFVRAIHAIDFSDRMIEIARAKAQEQNVANIRFETTSIDALEAPAESYDAILGMSILHLLPNRTEILAKLHRLLKPGGVFVSSTVCLGEANPALRLLIPAMRLVGQAPWVGFLNSDALHQELEQAGFTIEERWQPKKSAAVFIIATKSQIPNSGS